MNDKPVIKVDGIGITVRVDASKLTPTAGPKRYPTRAEVPKPAELAMRGKAWFRGDRANVHLGVGPVFIPAKKAHSALLCGEYDTMLERLSHHGAAIDEDPLPFEGRRHCYVTDPFGNRIELINALREPLDSHRDL